jgi:NAD(P)H-dependent FMN reductase
MWRSKVTPNASATFKEAIRSSDGLLIATPEYQHGVSGVLKNALDWASRPPGQSPMQRKSAAILGAMPGRLGTARAQTQLRESLAYTSTYTVLRPELLVSPHTRDSTVTGALSTSRHVRWCVSCSSNFRPSRERLPIVPPVANPSFSTHVSPPRLAKSLMFSARRSRPRLSVARFSATLFRLGCGGLHVLSE